MRGLRLGLGFISDDDSVNLAPTDIAWAGSHTVAEDAALGVQVGGLLTAVDEEIGTVVFTIPDATSKFAIGPGGNTVVVAGVLDFETVTSHNVTIRATDEGGEIYEEIFAISVTDVAEDAPTDPPPDDDVIVDDPTHFDVLPHSVVVDGSVKFAGKKKANGLSAKFMHDFSGDVGPLEANKEYIFEFTADFSQMAQEGALTAVGLMFKAGNDFYSVGVRGDGGATNLDVYQVDGENKWNQTSGFTLTDEGPPNHGTQWGPIWLKAIVSSDGTTLTLQTGTDVDTWDDELVEVPLGSFADIGDVAQWGIGGIFDSTDSGPYSINITYWEIAASAPPNWAITLFQSDFEGTDGQTTAFDDDTGKWTLTSSGTGTLQSEQKLFGNTAAFSSASIQGWVTETSADWCLSNSDTDEFTWEFAARWDGTPDTHDIHTIDGVGGAHIWVRIQSDGNMRFLASKVGTGFGSCDFTTVASIASHVANTWYRYRIEKNASNVLRIWREGTFLGKTTIGAGDGAFFNHASLRLRVGEGFNSPQNFRTDAMRILKGPGAALINADTNYTLDSEAFAIGPPH